jgi:prefoldin subunit 5
MSSVSERIYAKTNILVEEKEKLRHKINTLKQALDSVKKRMHRTELEIVTEAASPYTGGSVDLRMAGELRELNKERKDLHADAQDLKDLTVKYNELTKTIEDHRFWMRRADTIDPIRQREAEKKIFG